MSAQYIVIDRTKRHGAQLLALVDALRVVLQRSSALRSVMDQQVDLAPSPADYQLVEQQFGIPAGQGQNVYNLLAGSLARVNHADVTQFLDRLG